MRYKNGQRGSHNDFLCGLNQNSSDSNDSKLRWDIPMPPCHGDYTFWLDNGPPIFGE